MKISEITRPGYMEMLTTWKRWRLTFKGGRDFVEEYLQRFTRREEEAAFKDRMEMTYCPAFAKSAVVEIKNSIFQRLIDVTRTGGSSTYQQAINGELGGVDLRGSTMTAFIGRKVLPELLPMARIGIYIDAPVSMGQTLADRKGKHPYLYTYWAEDIRSWSLDDTSEEREFKTLLLRDHPFKLDEATGLPLDEKTERYRFYFISSEDGLVHVKFYSEQGEENAPEQVLQISKIPFVMLELDNSLLTDAADYQIAALNMASADVKYAVKSNVPIYTEQSDPRHSSPHLRRQPHGTLPSRTDTTAFQDGKAKGEALTAQKAISKEIKVGAGQGRQYAPNMDRPGFINPSPDPLRVSMEKQKQMKVEIRQLVHLAVTNLDVKMASAESKSFDDRGLEAGLSAIGLELEVAERKIGEIWSLYESVRDVPTIRYPQNYSLKTEQDRFDESKRLEEQRDSVPSITFGKILSKRMAKVLIGHHATNKELLQVFKEIDQAKGLTADPDIIAQDVERGLLSAKTGSALRGYSPEEADDAAVEHAERLARIAEFQTRGGGAQGTLGSEVERKKKEAQRQTDQDGVVRDKTRGKGK